MSLSTTEQRGGHVRIIGTICGRDGIYAVDVEDERIAAIAPADGPGADEGTALGGPHCTIAPALLDMQVNGFAGRDLNAPDASPEDVAAITAALHEGGVGLWCPTVTTGPFERMSASLRAVAKACEEDRRVAASVAAIHLEGPYISAEDGPRGAHPAEHAREPDADEFRRLQDAAGGRIGIVTLAPELPGAVEAGARLSTHLGNGAHALLPRHPNYIWEQLAEDRLWASLIADGHHLPPSVVRCFVRCKGPGRVILVSDAVRCAGLEAGHYEFGGRQVELTRDGAVMPTAWRTPPASPASPSIRPCGWRR
jgi:N-acetylglucosamine-6-phosphate deacetylase